MIVWKKVGIFAVSLVSMASIACGGSDGATGPAGAEGPAGAAGDKGDTGPAGTGTTPSVGVIVPNIGLLDREVDVTVTAQAVDFTAAAPKFDFGSGVTTSAIQVLSATTAYVHLTVDGGATTGVRDVKVTSGSNNLTSKGGFTVAAPLAVTVTPALTQGGLALVDVDNLDVTHAFDATADSGGTLFGEPITYPNFALQLEDGTDLGGGPTSVTATHAQGFFLVAPAAGATTNVIAGNIASGFVSETYAGDPQPVTAKAPTAATVGTPLTGQNIAAASQTNIYKSANGATASILEVAPTAVGTKISPFVAVYGDSGKAADLYTLSGDSVVFPAPATKNTWGVVLDSSLGGGAIGDYGFTYNVTSHTGTLFAEPATAHATSATAAAITPVLPAKATNDGVIVTGALATATEQDWYSLTLTKNDKLEITVLGDFAALIDVTDDTEASILSNDAFVAGAEGARLGSATQSITAAGAHTYLIHVTSADGAAKGNYSISLRQR